MSPVDRLIKAGNWLWLNKERIVIVIAVCVLGYRIYLVVVPPEPPDQVQVTLPRDVDNVPEAQRAELLPGQPPPRPARRLPETYRALVNEHPWWYFGEGSAAGSGEVTAADLGLALVRIQELGDNVRAQIRTPTTTRWYDPGEKFEEFELLDIDPDAGTVAVLSDEYQKTFVLELP